MFSKKTSGVTLIALCVIMVILLIIIGITLTLILGNNGILSHAYNAKIYTDISTEESILTLAVTTAKLDYGNTNIFNLQQTLNDQIGPGNASAYDNYDGSYTVFFNNSKREYQIFEDGSFQPTRKVEDETPGILSVSETDENTYLIESIEDLIAFSIQTNGGNSDLGIPSDNFSGKTVLLTKTLNFNSIYSYDDYTTKKYGNLNGDSKIDDLLTELTKTDDNATGFKPINKFDGVFDGQGYSILNIYQNVSTNRTSAALFTNPTNEIKNVNLSGTITNSAWHAAGIAADGNVRLDNCKNYANVTGYNMAAGICAYINSKTISNCINFGTIEITGRSWSYGAAGGIIAKIDTGIIENCINEGTILGSFPKAGIVGNKGTAKTCDIINCINNGTANSGIIDVMQGGTLNIINCGNLGDCNAGLVNSFSGADWSSTLSLNIQNSYNIGNTVTSGIVNTMGTTCKSISLNIENCYNAGESEKAILNKVTYNANTESTISIANTYYDATKCSNIGAIEYGIRQINNIANNSYFLDILNANRQSHSNWNVWILDSNGYPIAH